MKFCMNLTSQAATKSKPKKKEAENVHARRFIIGNTVLSCSFEINWCKDGQIIRLKETSIMKWNTYSPVQSHIIPGPHADASLENKEIFIKYIYLNINLYSIEIYWNKSSKGNSKIMLQKYRVHRK